MYARPWSSRFRDSSVGRPAFVAEYGLWDDRKAAAGEQVAAHVSEVDLVRLVFCDPHGLARSKTLTAEAFRRVLANGMDFSPGPFLFDSGHAVAVDFLGDSGTGVAEITGAGDFVVVPDPRTFAVLPRPGPATAWVVGDEYLRDGTPHPFSTRRVLGRVCEQFAARDLDPVVGLEVEWYLTRRLPGSPGNIGNGFGRQGPAPEVEAVNAGYQFNSDSYYDSVAAVTDPLALTLQELGLPLRSMEHESGPGQVETTFDPLHALDAADAMLLFRTLVKQTCARGGYHASFMSLPALDGFDPSGWHLHQSVVDGKTGRNLFCADGADGDEGAEGVAGISAAGSAYLAGMLARARELCLLSVPTVNGYRRLDPRFTLSPTQVGWSGEDRSALVRLLSGGESTHLENRVGEPCANPYLAMAGQLSAGLGGIEGGPDGTAALWPTAGAADLLPQSLGEALAAFRGSRAAERLLGRPLHTCLAALKQSELTRFEAWCGEHRSDDGDVTEWEQREYFDAF